MIVKFTQRSVFFKAKAQSKYNTVKLAIGTH